MAFNEALAERIRHLLARRKPGNIASGFHARWTPGLRGMDRSDERRAIMHYDYTAVPDADVPQAVEPTFQHILQTYASGTNKTVSVWRAVPELSKKPLDSGR